MLGLENTRLKQVRENEFVYRYATWEDELPVELARIALAGELPQVKQRLFEFELLKSGQNKNVSFAKEI